MQSILDSGFFDSGWANGLSAITDFQLTSLAASLLRVNTFEGDIKSFVPEFSWKVSPFVSYMNRTLGSRKSQTEPMRFLRVFELMSSLINMIGSTETRSVRIRW